MKKRKLAIIVWIVSAVVAVGAGIFALTEDCVHAWSDWKVQTEATCDTVGTKTRSCARCHEVETDEIPALGHKAGTRTEITKEPTCDKKGIKVTYCKVCNKVAKSEDIDATGHDYVEDIFKRVDATCTENGTKYYVCKNDSRHTKTESIPCIGHHSWDDAVATYIPVDAVEASCESEGHSAYKKCTRCGAANEEYQVTAPQHPNAPVELDKGLDATCTTVGYTPGRQCPDCNVWVEGHEELPAEHVLTDEGWVEQEASTCSTYGYATQECERCGLEQTKALPLAAHEFTKTVAAKPATCLEIGWSKHKVCEICGKQDSSYQVIAKKGHSFDGEGVCKIEGCGVYTYEFKENGDGTYSLSNIIRGEGDNRTAFRIPATYKDKPVTGIWTKACDGLDFIEQIQLPESVTVIGRSAFDGCKNLKEINLEKVVKIEESAFEGCEKLKEVALDALVSVGGWAFAGCSSLTEIVLTEKVTEIGEAAFEDCTKLVEITVPYIGSVASDSEPFGYVFGSNDCVPTSLKKITVLQATVVGENAFAGVGSAQEIILPETVTVFKENAFKGANSLVTVRFGETGETNDFANVTEIGANAFEATGFKEVILPFIGNGANVTNLGYAFGGDNGKIPEVLENVTVLNATKIAADAFKGAEFIKKVTLPDGVTEIGESAFNGCKNLIVVNYNPESVTKMGVLAFAGCESLESLALPFIGSFENDTNNTNFGYVFSGNTGNGGIPESLKTVEIVKGSAIAANAFEDCVAIETLTIPAVKSIGAYAFKGCKSLNTIQYADSEETNYLPEKVEYIGKSAFEGCFATKPKVENDYDYGYGSGYGGGYGGSYGQEVKMYSLTLPFVGDDLAKDDKVEETKIGYVFGGNDKLPRYLTSISVLGDTEIAEEAFVGCQYLEEIGLPETLKKIATNAFKDCVALKEIVVPNSVEYIQSSAFAGCTALQKMTLPFVGLAISTNEQGGELEISQQHFGYIFGHNSTANQVKDVPETLTEVVLTKAEKINARAFSGCSYLVSVTLPSTLKELGDGAFKDCTALENVNFATVQDRNDEDIEWTLDTIGISTFDHCSSLEYITLPASVKNLGDYAFYYCTSLKEIVTDGAFVDLGVDVDDGPIQQAALSVENLGYMTFAYSFARGSSLTMKDLETTNGYSLGVSKLKEVYIDGPITLIYGNVFEHSTLLEKVTLPDTVETIGMQAFLGCEKLTDFRMPNSIKSINARAFKDCSELVVLNDEGEEVLEFVSAITIADNAFENCVKLTEIVFNLEENGETASIGTGAFSGCENVEWIYLTALEEITGDSDGIGVDGEIKYGISGIGDYAFDGCGTAGDKGVKIFVKLGSEGDIPAAWSDNWINGAFVETDGSYTEVASYEEYLAAKAAPDVNVPVNP